jgi:hypothetical protein
LYKNYDEFSSKLIIVVAAIAAVSARSIFEAKDKGQV